MFKEIVRKKRIMSHNRSLSNVKLNQFFEGTLRQHPRTDDDIDVFILMNNQHSKGGYTLIQIFPNGSVGTHIYHNTLGTIENMKDVTIYRYKEVDVKMEVLGEHVEET